MTRTLLVGDVHGCAQELDDLLQVVGYLPGRDQLVLVGDLVARGPDSRGVLERLLDYQAVSVRGNHDDKLLNWWRVARRDGEREAHQQVRLSERHREVASSLKRRHFEAIEAMPLLLRLPEHGALVVHAGLDPARRPEETPEEAMLTARSVDAEGRLSKRLAGVPWASRWAGPEQVVFGHDARRGLQLHAFATGLDTGCCYGRFLTALVLDRRQPVPADIEARRGLLAQVAARAEHYPMSGNGQD